MGYQPVCIAVLTFGYLLRAYAYASTDIRVCTTSLCGCQYLHLCMCYEPMRMPVLIFGYLLPATLLDEIMAQPETPDLEVQSAMPYAHAPVLRGVHGVPAE